MALALEKCLFEKIEVTFRRENAAESHLSNEELVSK